MIDTNGDSELAALKERIRQNPSDLKLRFEIGKCLIQKERFKESIPELQRARQDPSLRKPAMELLASAFDTQGMHNLSTSIWKDIQNDSPDENDGLAGPGVTAPLKPTPPIISSAAKRLPANEEDDA